MIYNEYDKHAAKWLRNLIDAGHLPHGVVDERSIKELNADDIRSHRQVHLFAGIGGWPLALHLAGWPDDKPVWTGSCPCQPFSSAGKRKGEADERHLWPEMFRLIRECRPPVVIGEQVSSAIGHGWLDGVFTDLEGEGYACGAVVLGAHSVGAPHIRQRLYWVAESSHIRHERGGKARRGRNGSEDGGAVDGLEFPIGDGRRGERPADGRAPEAAGTGQALWLGDSPCSRREGQDGASQPECGPWAASRSIVCRDGKHRRIPIEPAFFPLANGSTRGRVGLLRGAGNCLCVPTAAEFVRAYTEATT